MKQSCFFLSQSSVVDSLGELRWSILQGMEFVPSLS